MADPTQLPDDENEFNIHTRLLDKFGTDFSPEARAEVERRAQERKTSPWLLGGALLSGFGDVAGGKKPDILGTLDARRKKIDEEETGKFDADKDRAVKDYVMSQQGLDRARKMTKENVDFGHAQTEYGDENDPQSGLSELARGAAKGLGLGVTDGTSYAQILKVYPFLKDKLITEARRNAAGLGGYAPGDAAGLAAVFQGITSGGDPSTWAPNVPTGSMSPKALGTAITGGGAAKGRFNTQDRFETPRGKPAQLLDDTSQVLTSLDSIGEGLPKWNTGFLRNRADAALGWAGLNSPERAAINARMGLFVQKYRLTVTGQAAGEGELARIESMVPNPNDTAEVAGAKLAEFQRYFRDQYKTGLDSLRSQKFDDKDYVQRAAGRGWLDEVPSPADSAQPGSPAAGGKQMIPGGVEPLVPPIERGQAPARRVVRKQVNRQLNKTRVTYSDGTTEEIDGIR